MLANGWKVIFSGERYKADLIENLLENNDIVVQRIHKMGEGFTLRAGSVLEDIQIYVKEEDFDKAMDFVSAYSKDSTEEETL